MNRGMEAFRSDITNSTGEGYVTVDSSFHLFVGIPIIFSFVLRSYNINTSSIQLLNIFERCCIHVRVFKHSHHSAIYM